ncbi:MAG: PorT family protein [Bacteroidota bacterium]|nr:PorT family protein [Bacteroidota bacterium]
MRQLFFFLIFSLAALRSQAQFGVQVGGAVTATNLIQGGTDAERGWNFRYNAGVLYRFRRLGGFKKVDFQPTLQYIVKGSTDQNSPNLAISEVVSRLRYVELSAPLLFRFTEEDLRNYTYNIGAGPYVAQLVSGRTIAVPLHGGDNVTTDLKAGSGAQDDIKPLDLGATLYMSMKLVHFSAGVNYDVGLLNVSPKPNETAYNRSFCIFFGYIF